jgi:hypothetical protein
MKSKTRWEIGITLAAFALLCIFCLTFDTALPPFWRTVVEGAWVLCLVGFVALLLAIQWRTA